MSMTMPGAPPRCTNRRSPHITATTMPMMMQIAYARIGIGPSIQTPRSGLGMFASTAVTTAVLTGSLTRPRYPADAGPSPARLAGGPGPPYATHRCAGPAQSGSGAPFPVDYSGVSRR